MAVSRGFRLGDRVSVEGMMRADGKTVPGRIICVNRKSRYDESIVVLCDLGEHEVTEYFKPDGFRYLPQSSMRVTLGWPNEY